MKPLCARVLTETTLAFSMALGLSFPAHADFLKLDHYVSAPSTVAGYNSLNAFQSSGSCLNWKYVPNSLMTSGSFIQSSGLSSMKFGEKKQSVYITALDLDVSPLAKDSDLEELKKRIFDHLKTDAQCMNQVKLKSIDQIVIEPAMVQMRPKAISAPPEGEARLYSRIFPRYEARNAMEYRDPMNTMTMTMVLDATNPSTAKFLKRQLALTSSKPRKIGEVVYLVDGSTTLVDSHLVVNASAVATFVSRLEKIKCHTSDETFVVGAIIPAPVLIGGSKSKTTCDYELRAHMTNGDLDYVFKFDHSRSRFEIDGKPIMVTLSDSANGDTQKTLRQFVEEQLLTQFLTSAVPMTYAKIMDNVFSPVAGKQGDITAKIKVDFGYIQNLSARIGFTVPIVASNLDASSFDFSWESGALLGCARGKYALQFDEFSDFTDTNPAPVAKDCLKLGL